MRTSSIAARAPSTSPAACLPFQSTERYRWQHGRFDLDALLEALCDAGVEFIDTLIEVKSSTGRAKDQLLVPVLLALRDELRQ